MIFPAIAALSWLFQSASPSPAPASPPPPPPDLPTPETPTPIPWFWLDRYQGSITRTEFENKLHRLFDPFNGLRPFLTISDEKVSVYPSPTLRDAPFFELKFASNEAAEKTVPKSYRTPAAFRALSKPVNRPLNGLHLAIDPGHIGGPWGQIENRSIYYKGVGRIQEGDCNIITAKLLRDQLTTLGASVYLVRETTDPVTPYRPSDFIDLAREMIYTASPSLRSKYAGLPLAEQNKRLGNRLQETSELLFYRHSEIHERGRKIRREFTPDLTITLYIDATPSSAWAHLTPENRNIFFVHGCYTKAEAADPAQQQRLFYKLLDNATPVEIEVASRISEAFFQTTRLPPVLYGDSDTTRMVTESNRAVVARNLAANREYDGPVVCVEPYFMNNQVVARRLVAGDYEGTRTFLGKDYPSIYREYAGCVVAGILAAYASEPPAPIVTANR